VILTAGQRCTNPVDDAVKALRKLGIDARGAERAVHTVLHLHP
jgi:hypothetical protein